MLEHGCSDHLALLFVGSLEYSEVCLEFFSITYALVMVPIQFLHQQLAHQGLGVYIMYSVEIIATSLLRGTKCSINRFVSQM